MKLRNKKTGEIKNAVDIDMYTDSVYLKVSDGEFDNETIEYHSLAELNEEWEDAPEEPKKYWYIDDAGVIQIDQVLSSAINMRKSIGNYFETKEEAEKAVEKLKAWKRLKDKGFKLNAVVDDFFCLDIYIKGKHYEEIKEDLKLVFGGEDVSE